jgi:hypothetical protein
MAVKRAKTMAVAAETPEDNYKTTSISLPPEDLSLLMDLAFKRRKNKSGRASVSAILQGLIERHRKELETELKG